MGGEWRIQLNLREDIGKRVKISRQVGYRGRGAGAIQADYYIKKGQNSVKLATNP